MKRITVLFSLLTLLMTTFSCSNSKKTDDNPFFSEWTTPYGVPPFDQIKAEHYLPAFQRAMSLHDAEIEAIVSNNDAPTFDNVILAYDNSGRMLEQVGLIFGMLCEAEATPQMQALQEEIMPLLSAHDDGVLMNEGLFRKVKAVYDERKALGLDAKKMRLTEHIYKAFQRAGAELPDDRKQILSKINEELALAEVRFNNNLLAENNDYMMVLDDNQLEGLPSSVREQAREKAQQVGKMGKWVITLHKPSLIPFLTYQKDRLLREEIYKAYLNRCNNDDEKDNDEIINQMVRLRCEKAHMLGYASYAHYVTAGEMAQTPEAVYKLLDEVWTPALERAKGELDEMKLYAEREGVKREEFASWDWFYFANKMRKEKYSVDEELLRSYFSLPNVQAGIFFLANRLYGITFRPIVVPTYHSEATAFEVLDSDESHLGVLYFDYYPRTGKSQGAW